MDAVTFTGLVWISSIKNMVAVRVMVKEEGSKRQAFAVIGSTDSKYVTNLNSLGLNVDLKFGHRLETPLMYTSEKGRLDEVKVLLEADANVNEKGRYGRTALMNASRNGHLQVVQELLKVEGINVNEKNNDGNTALILASLHGRLQVVQELLKVEGININDTNNSGMNARALAEDRGHHQIVALLT